ncbi:hypothetical protein [Agromyces italicus]|uniref:hypothetical protein n=1 Tax=Agromyces italicus TaxID=279572 RepID=UPI0012F99B0E|nr:hypothetical protein [Agromyces italicus]
MTDAMKLSIWGATSVVLFGGLLLVRAEFANAVDAADRSAGNSGMGGIMLSAALLLVALTIVTASLFFRNLAIVLRKRRGASG